MYELRQHTLGTIDVVAVKKYTLTFDIVSVCNAGSIIGQA
jgi:hypothetical protein